MDTAWDLGNGQNMAVWVFQIGAGELWVHDFIQEPGWYFNNCLNEVNRRGYRGKDYVPHDARVPSFETGRTRIETMVAAGRNPHKVADHHVDDGINAAKLMLPRCVWNAVNCRIGLEVLRQYRAEYDEKAKVFKTTAKHDWTSHAADGWRYLATGWREMVPDAVPPPKPLFKLMEEMTIDDWTAEDRLNEPARI